MRLASSSAITGSASANIALHEPRDRSEESPEGIKTGFRGEVRVVAGYRQFAIGGKGRRTTRFALLARDIYLEDMRSQISRRAFLSTSLAVTATLAGCSRSPEEGPTGSLEKVWGGRGLGPGLFQKPRALAIDAKDLLYIVDM